MPAKAKAAPEPPPPPPSSASIFGVFGEFFRQGAEGFIATQKILLDLAAQQNALGLTMMRERLGVSLSPGNKAPAALAETSVKNFVEAQKVVLEFAGRQNTIMSDTFKSRVAGTPVERLVETARLGVNNYISAQKHILGVFETQADEAIDDFAEGKPFDSGRMAKVARDGARDFLESQRKFIGIVQEQFTSKKEPATAEPEPADRVPFSDMMKSGVDAYVAAQQKLLDLGASQIEANIKFARDIFTGDSAPVTAVTDLVKKSAESYMAAQKALMDLAAKTSKAAAEAAEEAKPAATTH